MENVENKATLTVQEIAKVLNIGINNAYSLVRERRIRSVRIGRQYRVPVTALEAFLASDN